MDNGKNNAFDYRYSLTTWSRHVFFLDYNALRSYVFLPNNVHAGEYEENDNYSNKTQVTIVQLI